MKRIVLAASGVLVGLALVVVGVGAVLPREHMVAVEARFSTPPANLYRAITAVSSYPSWRSGVERTEVLSGAGEPLRWRETADWGTLTFQHDESLPERRVVSRIIDEEQGFGGTWTFELEPLARGTGLRITERGSVSNPVYRFVSRFFMGHYQGIETFATDLAAHAGETVTVRRVR